MFLYFCIPCPDCFADYICCAEAWKYLTLRISLWLQKPTHSSPRRRYRRNTNLRRSFKSIFKDCKQSIHNWKARLVSWSGLDEHLPYYREDGQWSPKADICCAYTIVILGLLSFLACVWQLVLDILKSRAYLVWCWRVFKTYLHSRVWRLPSLRRR